MEPIRSTGVEKYLSIIGGYDNEFAKWTTRTKKILKRYRDDTRGQSGNETAKFNILWSNVQTLIPAVYAKLPQADVSRRFGDNDPVSRVASLLIERAIDFEIEHYSDFRSTMRHSVEDRFLGGHGRGTSRTLRRRALVTMACRSLRILSRAKMARCRSRLSTNVRP